MRAASVIDWWYCSAVNGRPNSGTVCPEAAGAFDAIAASSQESSWANLAPTVESFRTTATVNPVAGSE